MAEVTIPTEEEIEQLPRWAKLAFAARCARRVLPLFTKYWPDAPKEHVDELAYAVEIAEKNASIAFGITDAQAETAESDEASFLYDAVQDAAIAATKDAKADSRSSHVAYTVLYAFTENSFTENSSRADISAAAADKSSISSIRSDFTRIWNASRQNKWTDDTPVPPSVFGPLDDIENDEHVVMALRAFGEPGVSASILADQMLAVYKALNVYTLAKYGKHLSRGEFRRLVLQNAGVPA